MDRMHRAWHNHVIDAGLSGSMMGVFVGEKSSMRRYFVISSAAASFSTVTFFQQFNLSLTDARARRRKVKFIADRRRSRNALWP